LFSQVMQKQMQQMSAAMERLGANDVTADGHILNLS